MTIQRMLELLEIEHECMLRGSHDACDRNCADCDLVQDDDELHEMYTDVIALLKEQDSCENCAIAIEDRQPVVRCKECKYGDSVKNAKDEPMIKCALLFEEWLKDPDWFCADGERKHDNG